jgi:hypothetical protein
MKRLAIFFLCALGLFLRLRGCNPFREPFGIMDMSASAKPLIGRVVTLRVEVRSDADEPNTTLTIDLPKGVKLVEGDLTWQGALVANQPYAHDVKVCVLYEGDWRIEAEVLAALPADSTDVYRQDWDTIHFITTPNSARTVLGKDYTSKSAKGIKVAPVPETPPPGICP